MVAHQLIIDCHDAGVLIELGALDIRLEDAPEQSGTRSGWPTPTATSSAGLDGIPGPPAPRPHAADPGRGERRGSGAVRHT